MKVLVLSNPVSGAGCARVAAVRCRQRLQAAGHDVRHTDTQPATQPTAQWLDPQLADTDLLVISGGDGAVRLASEAACRTSIPIYHLPCGTENLFAREFNMNRSEDTLLQAIEQWNLATVDIGRANGENFLLMASVGFDAEVVHELAQCRGSSISHWTYLRPILRQLARWRPPSISVSVDGTPLVTGRTGFIVVGNCRQYGWRLNPAGRASINDGLLDVAFFPARSRLGLFNWAWRCRRQTHLRNSRLIYRTGRRVEVSCVNACRYQLDGDPPHRCHQPGAPETHDLSLHVEVVPAALAVLLPPTAPSIYLQQ